MKRRHWKLFFRLTSRNTAGGAPVQAAEALMARNRPEREKRVMMKVHLTLFRP